MTENYTDYDRDIKAKISCLEGFYIVVEYGGIPINCSVSRVSVKLLEGFVNYLDNPQAYLINRHGLDPEYHHLADEYPFLSSGAITHSTKYEMAAEIMSRTIHPCLNDFDDVIYFGETENSLYCFWFDRSPGDCCVERLLKATFPGLDLDRYAELYIASLKACYENWSTDFEDSETPIVVKIPGLTGWISS